MTEDDLTLMPRAVRDKLDRVGIKLHLKEWALLSLAERRHLVEAPCDTTDACRRYAATLDDWIIAHCGRPADRLTARGER